MTQANNAPLTKSEISKRFKTGLQTTIADNKVLGFYKVPTFKSSLDRLSEAVENVRYTLTKDVPDLSSINQALEEFTCFQENIATTLTQERLKRADFNSFNIENITALLNKVANNAMVANTDEQNELQEALTQRMQEQTTRLAKLL